MEQKQWDHTLRHGVKVEQTLKIHLPTVQRELYPARIQNSAGKEI